ncbi:MAG: ADP-ribosylglycohydrolase family protein, partial [Gemmataceae bacterium]
MDLTSDPFVGCILGLAMGDALGAPHEGGLLEQFVWRWIGKTSDASLRWTDDTQMALDLAETLLDQGGVEPQTLAKRFATSYRWSRGYGPGAARVLKRIRRGEPWQEATKAVFAEGSYGNGAAMRSPVLALFFPHDQSALIEAARTSARVTHAHPHGIEGAILIARAAQALLQGRSVEQVLEIILTECLVPEFSERINRVKSWIESDKMLTPHEVAK